MNTDRNVPSFSSLEICWLVAKMLFAHTSDLSVGLWHFCKHLSVSHWSLATLSRISPWLDNCFRFPHVGEDFLYQELTSLYGQVYGNFCLSVIIVNGVWMLNYNASFKPWTLGFVASVTTEMHYPTDHLWVKWRFPERQFHFGYTSIQ